MFDKTKYEVKSVESEDLTRDFESGLLDIGKSLEGEKLNRGMSDPEDQSKEYLKNYRYAQLRLEFRKNILETFKQIEKMQPISLKERSIVKMEKVLNFLDSVGLSRCLTLQTESLKEGFAKLGVLEGASEKLEIADQQTELIKEKILAELKEKFGIQAIFSDQPLFNEIIKEKKWEEIISGISSEEDYRKAQKKFDEEWDKKREDFRENGWPIEFIVNIDFINVLSRHISTEDKSKRGKIAVIEIGGWMYQTPEGKYIPLKKATVSIFGK